MKTSRSLSLIPPIPSTLLTDYSINTTELNNVTVHSFSVFSIVSWLSPWRMKMWPSFLLSETTPPHTHTHHPHTYKLFPHSILTIPFYSNFGWVNFYPYYCDDVNLIQSWIMCINVSFFPCTSFSPLEWIAIIILGFFHLDFLGTQSKTTSQPSDSQEVKDISCSPPISSSWRKF